MSEATRSCCSPPFIRLVRRRAGTVCVRMICPSARRAGGRNGRISSGRHGRADGQYAGPALVPYGRRLRLGRTGENQLIIWASYAALPHFSCHFVDGQVSKRQLVTPLRWPALKKTFQLSNGASHFPVSGGTDRI
jgi:hypothetical protein